jgi:hypothetical protein
MREQQNIQYRISNVEVRNRLRFICKSIEFLPSSFDISRRRRDWTFDIRFLVFGMYFYAAMGKSSKVTTLNQDLTKLNRSGSQDAVGLGSKS